MHRVRKTLRRLLGTVDSADAGVHFHRRAGMPEVCYEAGCRLPHLSV
jgi:hypothetical protein